jgi:hypothetical protein
LLCAPIERPIENEATLPKAPASVKRQKEANDERGMLNEECRIGQLEFILQPSKSLPYDATAGLVS